MRFRWLIAVLIVFPQFAAAQDKAAEASRSLRRVREQIEKEETRLRDLRANQKSLEDAADKLGAEAAKAAERKQALLTAVEQTKQEMDRVSRAVAKIQQDIEDRKNGLRTRVVALYKTQRRTIALDYLFNAESSTDLLKRTRYLSAIANYDRNYLSVLSSLVANVGRDQARLADLQKQKSDSLEQAEKLEKELSKKREEKAVLAAEERDKIALQEKSLDKLRSSADKFEQVLASIMGGDRYVPSPEDLTPAPGPTPAVSQPDVIVSPSDGNGLDNLRGKMLFPVDGEIVQRFGKQKHDEFADMVFVKGLEIRAPVGATVKAVAAGKVVLSQVLPGYGNVIIVDHGKRYYTLYGRLAGALKSVGDSVSNGESLAVLGEPDYKGRNFYFELRLKGKATNPLEYFKNAPRMASG